MDAYLTKPVRSEALFNVLAEVIDAGAPAAQAVSDDIAKSLLRSVDRDRDLLVELTGLLRESAPATLADLREAVIAGDPKKVERAAHRLRGSVSHFQASEAVRTAASLEHMGRRGDVSGGLNLCDRLEDQVRDLIDHLGRAAQEVAV
jgi:HPt (histidine-containing phosphotransfer) domain-containing protein